MSATAHPSTARGQTYAALVLEAADRLLGLLDREPDSISYGSFDREHWAWKFRDFPLGMMQSGIYPLALLWRHAFPGNIFHGNPRVLDWILGAMEQTLARQHSNGAFDAFSPNEQDPGPTIGVLHGLGEAFRLVRDAVPPALRERFLAAQRKACDFARTRLESHAFVNNHWGLFAVAYLTAHELQGDPRDLARAEEVIQRILREQSADGWYAEYGGPDPGYESLGIFHLAVCWRRTRSPRLLDSLRRSVEFFSHCVHPDGSVGGVYGSRHTSLYFPAGFEILAGDLPVAGAVAEFMCPRLERRNVLIPRTSDAENLPSLAYTYLEALAARAEESRAPAPSLPCESLQGVRRFEASGIAVAGAAGYYGVVNASKGGVCRIFDRRTAALAYEDAGYLVHSGARMWTSQFLGLGSAEAATSEEVACSATLGEFRPLLPTSARFFLLRLLYMTLFRLPALGTWLRNAIVARLILARRPGPFRLHRRIHFGAEEVRFHDRLELAAPVEVDSVSLPRTLTAIHMGSAKYFHPADLVEMAPACTESLARELNRARFASVEFVLRFPAAAGAERVSGDGREQGSVSSVRAAVPR